jgi:PAS domain S-box-containing protein
LAEEDDWDELRNKVIGLGETSHRKSHYAQSREHLHQLERFRQLLDASEEIILVSTMDGGVIVDANGGACRKLGIDKDELVGLSLTQVCAYAGGDLLSELRDTGSFGGRTSFLFVCRDGRRFFAEGSVNLQSLDDDSFVSIVARDVSERLAAETELRKAQAALEALNASLEERVGARTRELAQAFEELRQAQAQLVQSETLASLGRMVAVIAHELNTPIGNSRIAASALHDESRAFAGKVAQGLRRSDLDDFVERMKSGTEMLEVALQRAADLVASFKQVAVDQTTSQRRQFDLETVISEIRTTLQPSLKRANCTVEWQVAQGLQMDSYPGPLGQVLMNLINNSLLHAFEGQASGMVRISSAPAGEEAVRITVADDGVGIPPQDQPHIFDPFFTTKMAKGGSGLGLNIVYNVVSSVLGGRISVDSEPGEGSRFELLLPRIAPVLEPAGR